MKKNNKGFSLVELIVVVLIMGIIAVALAPQVMKWVDEARKSNDKSNKAAYTSSIQTAFAEWQEEHSMFSVTTAISLTDESTVRAGLPAAASGFATTLDDVLGGDYPEKTDKTKFTFTIDAKGKVNVQ